MIRLNDEEIEIEREFYAVESRKIWAKDRTREWKLKKISELESCFSRVAKAQLKKVYEAIDKVYVEPDARLALAYLHRTLFEEVK